MAAGYSPSKVNCWGGGLVTLK